MVQVHYGKDPFFQEESNSDYPIKIALIVLFDTGKHILVRNEIRG